MFELLTAALAQNVTNTTAAAQVANAAPWADVMATMFSKDYLFGVTTALAFRKQVRAAFGGLLSKAGLKGSGAKSDSQ